MAEQIQVLFLPFLACLVLTGIHVYLGIHVISRKVIFVDIALAQMAALGATVAFLLGYDPRSEGAYYISLGFAVLAAVVFSLTRTKRERVPQEAVIGLAYATASAAAILLADISPHGAEHLHDLLAGSIVWVTPPQILKTAVLYLIIGLFHFAFRKTFLLISIDPEEAYRRNIRVRLWDFLFYLSFGVVITSSVQIAGVLLVFCYLVAPSVFAVMFFDDLRRRLLTGWGMATLVSAIGLLFSYDRPSGPTIMVSFAVALGLGGIVRAIHAAPRRGRAGVVTAFGVAAIALAGWALWHFRPEALHTHGVGRVHEHDLPAPSAPAPEHPIDGGIDALRAALRDTHENVRADAVVRLSATSDPRILPDVINALHDQSASVREQAAAALGTIGDAAALPALQHALRNRDEDEWVRLRMAQAVTTLGDAGGLPVLLDLARGADAGMARLEALTTLLRLSGLPDPPPSDPHGDAAAALVRKIERWIREGGKRLRFDPATRTFRR